MNANGRLLVGDKGFILGNAVFPESLRRDVPHHLEPSIGHYREWIEACKGGQLAGSNFDWAGPLAEAVLLGNVALRVPLREELTRHKLLWDPVSFKISNCEAANQFLRREYREGWALS